jgi:glucose 1-dehydrogenase
VPGGSPDACDTGRYTERGITALDGFASDLVVERAEHLVAVPEGLGRLAVLAEPASVCMRGIRHALAIGNRQPWEPGRALVVGAGAIGMLATFALRLAGHEVWTAAREEPTSEQAQLVAAAGARYVPTGATSLVALREDTGGFDLVLEATGDAEVMAGVLGLLRRNGVGCLLGIDGRPRPVAIEGRVLGVDAVIENRVLFGSVNAHPRDWRAAADGLREMRARWPGALERTVGRSVDPDRFGDAFAFRGVKATLEFST